MPEVRASQPGDAPSGARGSSSSFQSNEEETGYLVPMYLGSYNFGIDQQMLQSVKSDWHRKMISVVERQLMSPILIFFSAMKSEGTKQGFQQRGLGTCPTGPGTGPVGAAAHREPGLGRLVPGPCVRVTRSLPHPSPGACAVSDWGCASVPTASAQGS